MCDVGYAGLSGDDERKQRCGIRTHLLGGKGERSTTCDVKKNVRGDRGLRRCIHVDKNGVISLISLGISCNII